MKQVVEVPCTIGDRVWAIKNVKGKRIPWEGIVSEMFFVRPSREYAAMYLQIVVKHIARGRWGENIFGTYEEAQRKADELNGGKNADW